MLAPAVWAEGQPVIARYAGADHRCIVDRFYPGSEYHLLRYADAPHRASFVVHQNDMTPLEEP